jgi:hypothetical protein
MSIFQLSGWIDEGWFIVLPIHPVLVHYIYLGWGVGYVKDKVYT